MPWAADTMGKVEPYFAIPYTKNFGRLGTTKEQRGRIVFIPRRVVDLSNQKGARSVSLLLVEWLHHLGTFRTLTLPFIHYIFNTVLICFDPSLSHWTTTRERPLRRPITL